MGKTDGGKKGKELLKPLVKACGDAGGAFGKDTGILERPVYERVDGEVEQFVFCDESEGAGLSDDKEFVGDAVVCGWEVAGFGLVRGNLAPAALPRGWTPPAGTRLRTIVLGVIE